MAQPEAIRQQRRAKKKRLRSRSEESLDPHRQIGCNEQAVSGYEPASNAVGPIVDGLVQQREYRRRPVPGPATSVMRQWQVFWLAGHHRRSYLPEPSRVQWLAQGQTDQRVTAYLPVTAC